MNTTVQMEAQKAAIVREILNSDSLELLTRIKQVLNSYRKEEAPCQFTIEQVNEEIALGEKEFAATGICYTAEEVMQRMNQHRSSRQCR